MQICQKFENETNYKTMLYIPYRGDKAETEVFSGLLKEAKMLDLAYPWSFVSWSAKALT